MKEAAKRSTTMQATIATFFRSIASHRKSEVQEIYNARDWNDLFEGIVGTRLARACRPAGTRSVFTAGFGSKSVASTQISPGYHPSLNGIHISTFSDGVNELRETTTLGSHQ